MTPSVIKQVMALEDASVDELRKMWLKLFDAKAPVQSKQHLIPKLAYRLQELHYGALESKAAKQLDKMADNLEKGRPIVESKVKGNQLMPGTRLIREYQGVTHEVLATEDGLIYQGQRYTSLSAIASKIAGFRYNGLVFFGVKKKGDSN